VAAAPAVVLVLELAVAAVLAAAAEVLWTRVTEEDALVWLAELWVALVEVVGVVLGAEADVLVLAAGAVVAADVAAWVV
jgi:hypothetical protein